MSLLIDDVRRPATQMHLAAPSSSAELRGRKVRSAAECVGLFPVNLLSDEAPSCEGVTAPAHSWWLAHVRPRQEKAIAGDLLALGVGRYLPLVPRKSLARGQTRYVHIPLFPGYVFVCGTEQDRLLALKTNRIVSICAVPDGDGLRKQLASFAKLIAAGTPLVRESRLDAGERVRIKTGPFRDVEGVIVRRQGKTKLLVAIDFLGQGASFGIEDCGIEAV